jgi:hypothetical protein
MVNKTEGLVEATRAAVDLDLLRAAARRQLDESGASEEFTRIFSSIKRDLSHIATDRLQALVERYQRRAMIDSKNQALVLKMHFVMNEIGTRQLVEDVEKDLAEGEQ